MHDCSKGLCLSRNERAMASNCNSFLSAFTALHGRAAEQQHACAQRCVEFGSKRLQELADGTMYRDLLADPNSPHTIDEAAALAYYTDTGYEALNNHLRTDLPSSERHPGATMLRRKTNGVNMLKPQPRQLGHPDVVGRSIVAPLMFNAGNLFRIHNFRGREIDIDTVHVGLMLLLLLNAINKFKPQHYKVAHRGVVVDVTHHLASLNELVRNPEKAFKKGHRVAFDGLCSFSLNAQEAEKFATPKPGHSAPHSLLYLVHDLVAMPIFHFSFHPEEQEVLPLPGGEFESISYYRVSNVVVVNVKSCQAVDMMQDAHLSVAIWWSDVVLQMIYDTLRSEFHHIVISTGANYDDTSSVHIPVAAWAKSVHLARELRIVDVASMYEKLPGYRHVNPILQRQDGQPIDLDGVFVGMCTSFVDTDVTNVRSSVIGDTPIDKDRLMGPNRVVLLEGMAGIGKTTVAKRICWKQLFPEYVSLYIRAAELRDASREGLLKVAVEVFQLGSLLSGALMRHLWGKRIVWVVDGLDEIQTDVAARSLQCLLSPNDPFLSGDLVMLTSRPERGDALRQVMWLHQTARWVLQPWNAEATRVYVTKFFGSSSSEKEQARVSDLIEKTTVGSFSGLPLMCEIICGLCGDIATWDETKCSLVNPAAVYYRCLEELWRRRPTDAAQQFEDVIAHLSHVDRASLNFVRVLHRSFKEFLEAYHLLLHPSELETFPLTMKRRIPWLLLSHMVHTPESVPVRRDHVLVDMDCLTDAIVAGARRHYFDEWTTFEEEFEVRKRAASPDYFDSCGWSDEKVRSLGVQLWKKLRRRRGRITNDAVCRQLLKLEFAASTDEAVLITAALLNRRLLQPMQGGVGKLCISDRSKWRCTDEAGFVVELLTISGIRLPCSVVTRLIAPCEISSLWGSVTKMIGVGTSPELRMAQAMFVECGYFGALDVMRQLLRWFDDQKNRRSALQHIAPCCAARVFERCHERGRRNDAVEVQMLQMLSVQPTLKEACAFNMVAAANEVLRRLDGNLDATKTALNGCLTLNVLTRNHDEIISVLLRHLQKIVNAEPSNNVWAANWLHKVVDLIEGDEEMKQRTLNSDNALNNLINSILVRDASVPMVILSDHHILNIIARVPGAQFSKIYSLGLTIRLTRTYTITHCASVLRHLKYLRNLNLSSNQLGSAAIEHLVPALYELTNLQSLDLSNNQLDAAAMWLLGPALCRLTTLRSLNVSANPFHSTATKHLVSVLHELTALEYLDMPVRGLAEVAKHLGAALRELRTLQSLTLHCDWFHSAAMEQFAPALRELTTLQSLTLHGDFFDAVMEHFAPALRELRTLQSLTLHCDWFHSAATEHLAPVLRELTTLQSLTLHGDFIDAAAMEHFAPALRELTTLQSLTLHCDCYDSAAMEHFAPALRELTTLQSLTLYYDWFHSAAMEYLAPALRELRTLQSLTLHGDFIDAAAMEYLAPALRELTALQSLTLHCDRFNATMKHLAPALRTLQSLTLHCAIIDSDAMEHFAPALRELRTLQSLTLHCDWCHPAAMEYLAPALHELTILHSLRNFVRQPLSGGRSALFR